MSRPEPTGENRIVEPEEIFFSTTDAKGIIEKANSVSWTSPGTPGMTSSGRPITSFVTR